MDKRHWARLARLTQTCGPTKLEFLFQVVSNFEEEDFDALRFLSTSLPLEHLLKAVQPVAGQSFENRQLLQHARTRPPDSARDSFASFQSVQSQDSGYSSTGSLVEIPGSRSLHNRVAQNLQSVSHQEYTGSAGRKPRLIHAHQKETFAPTLGVVKNTNHVTSPHNESSPASSTYVKDKKFPCPICRAQGIDAGASRADDLKTHVKKFHCSNAVWKCPSSGCGLLFEFRKAYKKHAMAHRGGNHVPNEDLDATMIELVPQVVFACGFVECNLKSPVFEATDERSISTAVSEFCTHLAEHYHKAGSTGVGEWDFRVEIHNLLHQRACHQAWSEKAAQFDRDSFRWHKTSSFELKKVLERRHWEASYLPKILSIALQLGDLTLQPSITRSGSSNWRLPLPKRLTPFQSQNSRVDTFPQEAAAIGSGKFGLEHERYQVSATSRLPKKPDLPQDFVGKTRELASAKPMRRNTPYDDDVQYEESGVMPALTMEPSPSSSTSVATETSSGFTAAFLSKATSPGGENVTGNLEQPFNSEFQHQQLETGYPVHIQSYRRDFEPPPPRYTLPSNSNSAPMLSGHGLSTINLGTYAPELENTARKTLFGVLPSASQVPPNFSRPRKSYDNLRHQPRPVSVTMTDDDAPPMPGYATIIGTEATSGGVYSSGTSGSYAYTGF